MSSAQSTVRPREQDDLNAEQEPSSKRTKLEDEGPVDVIMVDIAELEEKENNSAEPTQENVDSKENESLLPPSHALLGAPPPVYTEDGSVQKIMETDVGISEYVGHDVPMINGIIKQR